MIKRLLQAITYYALLPWLYLISLLPFSLLYKLSDGLFYVLYYLVRYRRRIVKKNLRCSFPNKSARDLNSIEKEFYRYLSDLLVEHIKSFRLSKNDILARCQIENIELIRTLHQQGKHIVLLTSHTGNWEWAASSFALQTDYPLYAIYKPLRNPHFDALFKRLRQRFGRRVMTTNAAFKTMKNYGTLPTATAILADQASERTTHCVIHFLNQPTYIHQGVGKLSEKYGHTVVYGYTKRVRRGYYKVYLQELAPSDYFEQLEKDLQAQPAYWLWSHRRWKQAA